MKKLFFLPLIPVLFSCCGDSDSAIADGFVGAFVDSTGVSCSTKKQVTISKKSGSTLSVTVRGECNLFTSTVEGNVVNSTLTLKSGYFANKGYKLARGSFSLSNSNKTLGGSIDMIEASRSSATGLYDTTRVNITTTIAFSGKRL
jgi:hypothetical protein